MATSNSATKQPSSKFSAKLRKADLNELKSRPTARDTFASAINETMEQLRTRFGEMTMHGKNIAVHDWPGESSTKELTDALLKIDPKYDSSVRSWSQFKKKIPNLYNFFEIHCLFLNYLIEITICDRSTCDFFPDRDWERCLYSSDIRWSSTCIGAISHDSPGDRPFQS